MLSLGQAVHSTPDTGSTLPNPFGNLTQRGVQLRRGELHLLCARPANGKSAFALSLALKMKVPTLYLCPDTTAKTQMMRTVAQAEGRALWEVEREIDDDPVGVAERAKSAHPGLFWSFNTESLRDIDNEVMAYQEVFGTPPAFLIVDNLIDIAIQDGDEWGGNRKTLRELKGLAKELSMCVLVLHHVSESVLTKKDGAPASRDILGKDNRLAALVLTMGIDEGSHVAMAIVKNRYGKSDPDAIDPVGFRFDGPKMTFQETWTGG